MRGLERDRPWSRIVSLLGAVKELLRDPDKGGNGWVIGAACPDRHEKVPSPAFLPGEDVRAPLRS